MLRALLICLLLPALPSAQTRLDGAAFDAHTQGKTFYFGYGEAPYGAEEYHPNRRVRWSFLDGDCKEGYWYDTPERLICFVYEDRPDDPQCWAFQLRGNQLSATFENQGGAQSTQLYQIDESKKPMLCLGPKIGV